MRYDYSQPYVTQDEYLEVKGVNLVIELQDDDNISNKVKRFIQDITNFVLDHLVMEYNCNELNRQTHNFEDLAEFRRVRFHYGMLDQIEYVLNNGLIQLNSGINMETGAITDFSAVVIGPAALRQFRLAGFCNKQEKPRCNGDLSPKDMPTIEELVLELSKKVDEVDGKGLSANDFTNAYKMLLDSLSREINEKVDKVVGKVLSSNDFTDAFKEKLQNIEAYAQANVIEEISLENQVIPVAGKKVNIDVSGKEDKSNKVTEIDENSTDSEYPSAKAVNDLVDGIEERAKEYTDTKVSRDSLVSIIGEARQYMSGLMSAEDKNRVDALFSLFGDEEDADTVVDTFNEVLAIFNQYPEGVELVTVLANKVNYDDILNVLNSTETRKALSAAKGKELKDLIDALTTQVNGKANKPSEFTDGHLVELTSLGNLRDSQIAASDVQKKVGSLPCYSVNGTNNVLDFIRNNNLADSNAIVIKYITGANFLGSFIGGQDSSHRGFEFEDVGGTARFYGRNVDLTNLTFYDLFIGSTYREDYEITKNKVTSLSSSSTNTEYPSAKAVYDELTLKVDKNGPLPQVIFNGTQAQQNLYDLLTSLSLIAKVFCFNYGPEQYIACFHLSTDGTHKYLSFEIEKFAGNYDVSEGKLRFYGQDVFADDLTLQSLLSDNSYRADYELSKNKVTSLSGSSTNIEYPSAECVYNNLQLKENVANKVSAFQGTPDDTHYPTEKLVYDNLQNIREVAEGKCNTFVLHITDTIASLKELYQSSPANARNVKLSIWDASLNDWTDVTANLIAGDYDNLNIANSSFDTNDNYFNLGSNKYLLVDDNRPDSRGDYKFLIRADTYFTGISPFPWKNGDIILVTKISVPDRWFAKNMQWNALETTKVDLTNYYTKTEIDSCFTAIDINED